MKTVLMILSIAGLATIAGAAPRQESFTNGIGMEMVWLPQDAENGGYWVGKYEVTGPEYQKVMGNNPSYFKGTRRPVDQVSWHDANEFAQRLTDLERAGGNLPAGYGYALPTEKQWEYYVADAELSQTVHDRGHDAGTADVGSKDPNRFGLHDVRGNLWEWCADWHDSDKVSKVLRGASWITFYPNLLDTAYRLADLPGLRNHYYGFRVVLVPADESSSR